MNKYYVYIHINPVTNQIFYVGKGKGYRAYNIGGRSKWWNNTVNKNSLEIDFIKKDISNEEAMDLERYWITKIGRRDQGKGPLINLTDGGDGPSNQICSEETRKKMCIARRKRTTTEATKLKMSISRKARLPITEETRKKMCVSQKDNNRIYFTKEEKRKARNLASKKHYQLRIKTRPKKERTEKQILAHRIACKKYIDKVRNKI